MNLASTPSYDVVPCSGNKSLPALHSMDARSSLFVACVRGRREWSGAIASATLTATEFVGSLE